jgi:transaldolase
LHDLVHHGIAFGADRLPAPDQAWWRTVAGTGTRPWLDTGDMDEAASLWCSSFAALTTNNTLLNKEVQKGLYDGLVQETAALTAELPERERIVEIGFVLNARHGLRLASRFGGRVSVELHTDLADDVERSVAYGRRYFAICPEHFIVKIPLTPAGLLATRRLRADGIPVNFTLGFSARQNLFAAALSAPSYVNVFLGRLNAYVADNHLGDGVNVGEKTTLASQRAVRERTAARLVPTLQIAASMRNGAQVVTLAGVDVHTMPPAAAKGALAAGGPVADRTADDLPIHFSRDAELVAPLWTIGAPELALADDLEQAPPVTPGDVVARFTSHGLGGMFPTFTAEERTALAADGKIPKHDRWLARLRAGTATVDGLCTAAALASFTADQAALDGRIRKLLG